MTRKERGFFELYEEDAERADYLIFGRIPYPDRRGFLRGAGLAAMTAVIGTGIPFHRYMSSGLIPSALAEGLKDFKIEGKDGLTVLNDRPVNAETPAHLLDDDITPTERHFIRNNGIPPESADPASWTITIDGLVDEPLTLSIDDLKSRFDVVTHALQIECAGNGRAFFNPPAKGNQWTVGAIANSRWTGVRLADVLRAAGVKDSAIYTAHYGADTHLSGDPEKLPISRGVPIEKAMSPYNLIAFAQNDAPIHPMNGAPLRLVIPGWPGSCSQKWVRRVELRDVVHDGPKMTGTSYRVPAYDVAPGTDVPEKDFRIIHSMPVKSIITSPASGIELPADTRAIAVRGHAWAGDNFVSRLDVTADFGETWVQAHLDPPPNPYAWQSWSAEIPVPGHGYYEIWARATDSEGNQQPFAINWNPKGYLGNVMHRIAVTVPA